MQNEPKNSMESADCKYLSLLYIADPHDHQAEDLEELVEEEVVSKILFIQYCLFCPD